MNKSVFCCIKEPIMSNVPKNKKNAAVLYREGAADYIVLSTGTDPSPKADEAGAILEYSDTGDRFRWSSTAWIRTGTGGGAAMSNYLIEVGLGNVPGTFATTVSSRNPAVGSVSVEDVWDPGGVLIYPTAGEQWEIVSASVNDTSAGTGARSVTILYLDDQYVKQFEVVTLNGTTPVTTTATDMFRLRRVLTTTAGSLAENDGELTIRVAGGGNTRGAVLAGNNTTMAVHYTVPAGVTAFIVGTTLEINKGEDVVLSFRITFGPTGIFLNAAESFLYQSINRRNAGVFQPIVEKSDFRVQAISSNAVAAPAVFLEILEIDN